jgi:hypothetical protein
MKNYKNDILQMTNGNITFLPESNNIKNKKSTYIGYGRLILNPNIEELFRIINKIYINGGYCITQEKSYETKCPCDRFMTEEECSCRMFVYE